MASAERMVPRFDFVTLSWDAATVWANWGMATAAKIPRIATTSISSINVYPFFSSWATGCREHRYDGSWLRLCRIGRPSDHYDNTTLPGPRGLFQSIHC